MNTTTIHLPQEPGAGPVQPRSRKNPWASDTVLLGLSIWWVQMTRPESSDPSGEVAVTFDSLQRDLQ